MLVGLLRHGEVQGGSCFRGSRNDPLTDIGLDQMRAATDRDHCWDRVITSPLSRCADFAREYAQRLSLPITFDDRFKEIHFGAWEGRTAAELYREDPIAVAQFWDDPERFPPPCGEALSHFQARVLDAWRNFIQCHSGERLLIVTHGGVIRILLCHLQQRPIGKLLEIEVNHGDLYKVRIGTDAQQAVTAELIG